MREGRGEDHAVAQAQSWPLIQEEVPKVPGTCRLVLNKVGVWLKLGAHSFEDCAANRTRPARPSPNPHSYGPVTMNACLNLLLSVGLVAKGVCGGQGGDTILWYQAKQLGLEALPQYSSRIHRRVKLRHGCTGTPWIHITLSSTVPSNQKT